jgi:D-threo-aldose 1-dehydrogenase
VNEALPALEALREEGIVRAIGVGSGALEALLAFAETGRVDALMIAGRYTLLEQPAAERLLPLCDENGISVINAGVFNSGLLATDQPQSDGHYEYRAVPAEQLAHAQNLAATARRFHTTLPQAALSFAAAPSVVASVVVGAESAEHVDRNLALFSKRDRAAAMLEHLQKSPSRA